MAENSVPADGLVSHGICTECREYFFPLNGKPPTFAMFLDRLAVPVIVVDSDVRVVAANVRACGLLGKELCELRGKFGGDAIECAYARLPEGCGRTVHCKSCTIRLLINDTYATGEEHYDVPASIDAASPNAPGSHHIFISTLKLDDVILLKIADAPDSTPVGK